VSRLLVPADQLPTALSPFDAVDAAYPDALAEVDQALGVGLPVLVSCDKGLTPFLYRCLRNRLKARGLSAVYLDGRPREGDPPVGMLSLMLAHLRDAVRGSVRRQVIVLPHLDLLLSSATGGLSGEAREVVALLYENPTIVWLGFADLSLALPEVARDLFPVHVQVVGTPRHRLAHLVLQREARKLHPEGHLPVYQLYKAVSGLHAVALRRLLGALDGEDFPADPTPAWTWLRSRTLTGDVSLPDVDLHAHIGGYGAVKKQLQEEILDLLAAHSAATDPTTIAHIEALVPKGMIFWGPPGTGKTLFAKAMATALGAAFIIVSGPELKSKWVGESEANLRRVFVRARQSAPCVVVFDELDSFATTRGAEATSGAQHSMVNQLLTELDGFRSDELVFVIGTTNLVESLDPALLRPGRFEFHLAIPYPNADDRRAILSVHDRRLGLQMTSAALERAVRRSGVPLDDGRAWSGDHLEALCRAIGRSRLRAGRHDPTTPDDVQAALDRHTERPHLTPSERRTVAIHEAGHAVLAMLSPHLPPVDRISIEGDLPGALGFVRYAEPTRRHVQTRAELEAALVVLYGGQEAERMLLGDVSAGAVGDLARAEAIARSCVTELGFLDDLPVRRWTDVDDPRIEAAITKRLEDARQQAISTLHTHRDAVLQLTELLLERGAIDRTALAPLLPTPEAPHA